MCHISRLGERTEKRFDMYGNKSEKTSREGNVNTQAQSTDPLWAAL